jgi:alkylhydroperoxidase family enzyme
MSFIDTPDHYPYRWYLRPLLFLLRHRSGGLSEPVRLWGRTPAAFLGSLWMLRALERRTSPLNAQLRALLRARISQIDVCPFCIDLNGSRALELGVPEDKLCALPTHADSPLYDEAEKAALVFAEAITITGRKVDAELMARLKRHYSDDAIVELAALIAHQNLSAKFNTALGVKA